jgi:hypothetical protein
MSFKDLAAEITTIDELSLAVDSLYECAEQMMEHDLMGSDGVDLDFTKAVKRLEQASKILASLAENPKR